MTRECQEATRPHTGHLAGAGGIRRQPVGETGGECGWHPEFKAAPTSSAAEGLSLPYKATLAVTLQPHLIIYLYLFCFLYRT
jgi:hypothetical protein